MVDFPTKRTKSTFFALKILKKYIFFKNVRTHTLYFTFFFKATTSPSHKNLLLSWLHFKHLQKPIMSSTLLFSSLCVQLELWGNCLYIFCSFISNPHLLHLQDKMNNILSSRTERDLDTNSVISLQNGTTTTTHMKLILFAYYTLRE